MNKFKIGVSLLFSALVVSESAQGQALKTASDSVSYALGRDLGSSLTKSGVTVIEERFMQGLIDGVEDGEALISAEEGMRIIKGAFAKAAEEKRELMKKEQTVFFEQLKDKQGVVAAEDGLYYEVLQEGDGVKPTLEDEVLVHYKGSLANGKEFDSSYKRGEPLSLRLSSVIKGWQLGIPLMSVGAKYKLYIPSELGYGERGAGADIPPFSALIFEIELINIKEKDAVD
ncbi:FKBP-type peptidyl-prolyl cis-trans isomerase [Sphingobacterium sp. UT-1RO-CII-1]|uniref:FKBP-type peptidyl-prolyl cis-trans isomerase n=1 Tax=Sphingobacterium sp. UT-1RO-CII-1 TaxID=2995225 RepID=UPI00227A6840|nr:FKBP-type peptidyl-prolyl cis-trans isomerase [Sphingobacterium sp. UT-1RO-CII-1]MCY4781301.1 FKBP-type peptidyl-prolyl cis-trans isomerase [Sphingobacterium sp. UT-1RO-CII-1]